jgi:hypothetical protein
MPDLLSSDEARELVDRLRTQILADESLYLAAPSAMHTHIDGRVHVFWTRPKALGHCAALRAVVDEYARLRDLFDPVDELVRSGADLGVLDRAGWERNRLQLMGLEFALRTLVSGDGGVR